MVSLTTLTETCNLCKFNSSLSPMMRLNSNFSWYWKFTPYAFIHLLSWKVMTCNSMFTEKTQLHPKHHSERAPAENVGSLSCWPHSGHTVLSVRKGFVFTRARGDWGRAGWPRAAVHHHCLFYGFIVLLRSHWHCSFTSCRLRHVWVGRSDRCWGENHQQQTQDQQ